MGSPNQITESQTPPHHGAPNAPHSGALHSHAAMHSHAAPESTLHVTRWRRKLVTAMFIAALWLPFIGAFRHWEFMPPHEEKRDLAPRPRVPSSWQQARSFPARFTAFYDDHFGFRGSLVTLQALTKLTMFAISPVPQVVVGKNGWLYHNGEKELSSYTNSMPFTPSELQNLTRRLEERRAWLARRNCLFIVLFAPDKPDIYPEYLPSTVKQVRPISRQDEMIAYLRDHSHIDVVDVRAAVRNAKSRGQIYLRLDGHWTEEAGFVATQQLASELHKYFPAVHPLDRADFEPSPLHVQGGDLAAQMGMDNVLSEDVYRLQHRGFPLMDVSPFDHIRMPITTRPDPALPTLVAFRDSFMAAMAPFMAEHFSQAFYVWSNEQFIPDDVKEHHPQVVIEEWVETKLAWSDFSITPNDPQVQQALPPVP